MENLGYDKEAVIAYLNNEDGGMKNEWTIKVY
jgi:hypothetical protein